MDVTSSAPTVRRPQTSPSTRMGTPTVERMLESLTFAAIELESSE
jgi:hypothetical protein